MRRAAKVDRNHAEIKRAFEALGAFVVDSSRMGEGFPDMVIGFRSDWILVEVKDGYKSPSRRALTPAQLKFNISAKGVGCETFLVESVADVVNLMNWAKA